MAPHHDSTQPALWPWLTSPCCSWRVSPDPPGARGDTFGSLVTVHRGGRTVPAPTDAIATVFEDPPQAGPYLAVRTGLQHFTRQVGPASGNKGVVVGHGHATDRVGDQCVDCPLSRYSSCSTDRYVHAGGHLQPLLSYLPRILAHKVFAEPVMNAGIWQALRDQKYRTITLPDYAGADIDTYQDAVNHGIAFSEVHGSDRAGGRV